MSDQISKIQIGDIKEDHELQCRATSWNVDDLVPSIQRDGQLQPVLVRPLGKKFQLISGFRRVTALKQLGSKWVKARIMHGLSDADARRLSLAENLDRQNLSDWDKVVTAARFRKQGLKNEEIATNFRVKVRSIQRWLRVAESPDDFRRALERGDITVQQAYEALKHGVSLTTLTEGRGRSVRYLRSLSHKRTHKENIRIQRRTTGEIIISICYKPGEMDLTKIFDEVQKRLRK